MKTYLLLRDNDVTGPYTREGLTQMELGTFDLLWIVDESIVWKYPSEINEFKQLAGHAPVSQATRVNSLKERQIRYFREFIGGVDFRSMHLDEINTPDAFVHDIPNGYEYLLVADNYNKYGGSVYVGSEDIDNTGVMEEAAVAVPEELCSSENEYFILGEKQKVDTVEVRADLNSFTSYFTGSENRKKNSSGNGERYARRKKAFKRRNELYSLTIMLGLVISSLAGYLK